MDEIKKIYKQMKCDLCDRYYEINYYYSHKKSKSHLKKKNAVNIRQNLLKDDIIKENNNTDVKILIQEIEERLNLLKDMI